MAKLRHHKRLVKYEDCALTRLLACLGFCSGEVLASESSQSYSCSSAEALLSLGPMLDAPPLSPHVHDNTDQRLIVLHRQGI